MLHQIVPRLDEFLMNQIRKLQDNGLLEVISWNILTPSVLV